MSLLRPFTGLRPDATHAKSVIAPPYDVLNADEARVLAAGAPDSFLHVSKAEIDLPSGADPYSPAVYAKARENFERLCNASVLRPDPAPYYYIYRLTMGTRTQTGVVAAASCAAYDAGRIRKHEHTRPDKEDDRVRHIQALNAQTGPVFLAYRRTADVEVLIAHAAAADPEIDVTAHDGVRHCLWVVRAPDRIEAFTRAFEAVPYLYICDGHHRSAAAARVARAHRAASAHATGAEPCQYFLAVVFPDDQLRILDYNRLIKDLNGLSVEQFLTRVRAAFTVEPNTATVRPGAAGEFGMYLDKRWYRLRIDAQRIPRADPVKRLDASLLQDHLIDPILGIADPRRDKRIDFVGGIRGLAELERRVDSGEMAAAFALYPTALADLMAVADAGQVMPPKSTWFEPKLADGLVSHVID